MSHLQILVTLSFFASAATPALDLTDVFELASKNDAQLASDTYERDAALLSLPIAKSAYRPSLSVSAELNRSRSDYQPVEGDDRRTRSASEQLALSLNQTLFNGETLAAIGQAKLAAKNSELTFQIAYEAFILRVVQAYFDVLSSQDALVLARAQTEAFSQQLELASERLEVGLGTKTDKFEADARYLLAESGLIAADNEASLSKQRLQQITGTVLDSPLKSINAERVSFTLPAAEQTLSQAMANNASLQFAGNAYAVAELGLVKAGRARWPTLGLTGAYADTDNAESASSRQNTTELRSLSLNLSVPLYQGNALIHQQKQAGHRKNAAEQRWLNVQRQTRTDAMTALSTLQSLIKQAEALALSVRASESAAEAKLESFKAGLSTNTEVLDAQSNLYAAKTDVLKARYDAIIALLAVERVRGDLNFNDVTAINNWLH